MAEPAASLRPCNLCGGQPAYAFATADRNRALSAVRFAYSRCTRCSTYALCDIPADLGRYYPVEYYGPEDRAAVEAAAASPGEQGKLALIRAHVPGGRLVEIGPGGGQFSLAARDAGFSVSAIDMDERACARFERIVGAPAVCSADPDAVLAGLQPSDVVALWHVLEHLRDPGAVLERIAENLRMGGVAALAMPNPQSLQFRLLRGRWAHVDAPRHLHLIPLGALVGRLMPHGLQLVSVTTADAAGRQWNWFGWEYALRRFPARRPSTPLTRLLAAAITGALAPIEQRSLAGSTYTAIFAKRG